MVRTQGVETTQAHIPQQFTPEEATQILTDAVNISSQYLSLAQMEAIADEAGIPRETLYEAIQRRVQQVDLETRAAHLKHLHQQLRRERRRKRFKKLFWLTAFAALLVGVFVTASEMQGSRNRSSEYSGSWFFQPPREQLEHPLEQLAAFVDDFAVQKLRGKTGVYYVMPYAVSSSSGSNFTSIWRHAQGSGSARLVFKTQGQIVRASLSEDEKFLAVYVHGYSEGGVWVLNLASGERHRVLGEFGTTGYHLPSSGHRSGNAYAAAYGGEVSWVGKRELMFSTTDGRYFCKLNERGVPLEYFPFDEGLE